MSQATQASGVYKLERQRSPKEKKQMEMSNSIMTKKINQVFRPMVNYELSRGGFMPSDQYDVLHSYVLY